MTRLDVAGSEGGEELGDLLPQTGPLISGPTVTDLLNEAPTSQFHRRTVIISGVGFFPDAYDLFVIGTVAALVAVQWHLSTLQTSWVTGAAILGAFIGAFVFGRIADVIGRKKLYVTVAVIMIIGAIALGRCPRLPLLAVPGSFWALASVAAIPYRRCS